MAHESAVVWRNILWQVVKVEECHEGKNVVDDMMVCSTSGGGPWD